MENLENWMSRIDDSKKLILMNIPGTHDSAAYCMNRISFKCAKTQDLTIKEQLEIGIRDFDIRIFQAHEDTSQDEDIICCHGICDCYVSPNFCDNRKLTYKSVLLDVKNFLEKNPTEAVLFSTFLGRGKWKKGYMLIRAYHLFDKYVGDISIRYRPDLLMGDVRGKIINYTTLIEEFDARENMIVTKTRNIMASTGINDVHRKYQNCATFKTNGNIKVREMQDMFRIYKMTLEEAQIKEKNKELTFPIQYSISCTGEYDCCLPHHLNQAMIVHSFVQKEGIIKNGYYYGWLHMDFANSITTKKLIDANFPNKDY
jgi:hypothetical protein